MNVKATKTPHKVTDIQKMLMVLTFTKKCAKLHLSL
nr:MAG TPA: hypothetical protein [Caudoviricetes sp.]